MLALSSIWVLSKYGCENVVPQNPMGNQGFPDIKWPELRMLLAIRYLHSLGVVHRDIKLDTRRGQHGRVG
jgi:serine/threonine protein kinase